jgi:hypothetical protein
MFLPNRWANVLLLVAYNAFPSGFQWRLGFAEAERLKLSKGALSVPW